MVEVSDSTVVEVQNLADYTVVFVDDDTHRRFTFQPFEKKKVAAEVLRRLNYSYGGSVLLKNFLSVKNSDLAREFGVDDDTIEYTWTEKDVDRLLGSGSIDELKDALEFGPEGIKDLIVDKAIKERLNDMQKREAIKEMTGKDINNMIALQEQLNADKQEDTSSAKKGRRVTKKTATTKSTTGRRAATKTKAEE